MLSLECDSKNETLEVEKETKTRLLEFGKNFSFGEKSSGNMITQGDNREVLKSFLPFYRGRLSAFTSSRLTTQMRRLKIKAIISRTWLDCR